MNSNKHAAQSTRSGYIFFLLHAQGSKSESDQPFLASPGHCQRLHYEGDNPFDNSYLRRFHRQLCRVSGFETSEGVFRVTAVEPLADAIADYDAKK